MSAFEAFILRILGNKNFGIYTYQCMEITEEIKW